MTTDKTIILNRLCYTNLVYDRINKKLNSSFSRNEIEKLLSDVISETDIKNFKKKGKNIYVSNELRKIRVTINSFNFRIITVDLIAT